MLSALEQGAYSFNHKLVGHWARASFHDEFLGLLKLALADETLLRFVQQNDDNCRSYHEILAFMEANKRMFGGELRSIIAQRTAPVRLGGPKFQLNPWRMHQAIVAASKTRTPRAHRKRQRRVAADA